jgi:hypothetical protein
MSGVDEIEVIDDSEERIQPMCRKIDDVIASRRFQNSVEQPNLACGSLDINQRGP